MRPATRLLVVKFVHTLVWAFFAGCIVATPLLTYAGQHTLALTLVAVVFLEVLVLVFNGWTCPLTDVAARCTDDRRDNFDIFLPLMLARYNKQIFGVLYVAGAAYAVLGWSHASGG